MFHFDQIVPWGRSFDEYRRMFALTDHDLRGRILGCADGPAGFNAEATRRGGRVVSCDPLYRFDNEQIAGRIEGSFDEVVNQTRQNTDSFVWDSIGTIEDLARIRREAMQTFLEDYEAGRCQGRYVDAALPELPFPDASFDLALCSHFLFLYSDQLNESFHRQAALEMCRVAAEVRIFPLLSLGGGPCPYVSGVIEAARDLGWNACHEAVPYEFQRGGNQMLRLTQPV